VREVAEFVSLYSAWRGSNRFLALVRVMDLLRDHPDVTASRTAVPALDSLRSFIRSGVPLGNPSLEAKVQETEDPELASVLRWSRDVNADIAEKLPNAAPFRGAGESLAMIHANSDAICVSQTPTEALVREWDNSDMSRYVSVIAGQELGSKSTHIALAAGGKYSPGKILIIGDALGDREAARENGALFYPVNPGREEESWERFHDEAYGRFLAGDYAGEYESTRTAEFQALLPRTPPWKT
jgi:phosphoglycolate phosphatase-like HAD superfamily hydrolase